MSDEFADKDHFNWLIILKFYTVWNIIAAVLWEKFNS